MYHHAALLLGSNLGDKENNLLLAQNGISQQIGELIKISSIYSTEPWGNLDQPGFLNQAVYVNTELVPEQLMATILTVEKQLGRVRQEKWGTRIIDIDILFIDNLVLHTHDLVVPHPLMQERRFSLLPLSEICPVWVHPLLNKDVLSLLADCPDTSAVTLYQQALK